MTIVPASDYLDAAEALARHQDPADPPGSEANSRRLITGLHSLRRIERAIVTAATHLGAELGIKLANPNP